MGLKSLLFQGEAKLEACLVRNDAHIVPGAAGQHVVLIQDALKAIDKLAISPEEIEAKRYGPSTTAAVLAYKRKRKIINSSYQKSEDNIVGKMTIKSLDDELVRLEGKPQISANREFVACPNNDPGKPQIRNRTEPPDGVVAAALRNSGPVVA